MIYIHAKGQGQRSLRSKVRVKTDGHTYRLTERQRDRQMKAIALPSVLSVAV